MKQAIKSPSLKSHLQAGLSPVIYDTFDPSPTGSINGEAVKFHLL